MIESNVFYEEKKDGITLLKYKALMKYDFIRQAVSTRSGGVSTKKGLESLNLGTSTADEWENVVENYRRFCSASGFEIKNLVLGKQTHSINVRTVTKNDCGKGVLVERDYTDVDALITNEKNIPLIIHTADCVPVAFIDTKARAIGNAHSGWRGTFDEIAKNTVEKLKSEFGVMPNELLCTIGPNICQKCYEVSKDLFESFKQKFGESESLVIDGDRYYIDLSGINRQILIESGVKEDNIIMSDLCTCCRGDLFFSHRGQGPERGIIASGLELI